ncbi:hypothetical protein HDC92_003396 [Pedobacter sp. AK017]|uniref:RagB/SusD family nutrient uptake outer membrane protein n=1 Tax=Pedobacter sp. AK017 TaxID=2723073 RepID=UPI00160B1A81|nr:RagB/SusD family nutrient uptake outer membrane protein [Pedobacter sp. AK017]MBB5439700.1 hypothetical protein [Pedobacter sp. AK017]
MKNLNLLIRPMVMGLVILTAGCKGFVEIDPPVDQIVSETVFTSDDMASSAIRGIYARMMTANGFASGYVSSVTLLAGKSSDEFINYNTSSMMDVQFASNNLLPDNGILRTGLWQEPYKYIYYANAVLENLQKSDLVSADMKSQLEGEALFIRAFCHFYLSNLFGEVPVILTTDYRVNAIARASSKTEIYTCMVKDLLKSKALLPESYPAAERTRPNKWAATALLARVYLYQEDWVNAEKQATEVIQKTNLYKIQSDLNQAFLKNSEEAILQFAAPASTGVNTREGQLFILTAAPGASTAVILSSNLTSSFDPNDQRAQKWIGTFTNAAGSWKYAFKYKVKTGATVVTEYSMVLRLAEQYLIRAEARINQGNVETGVQDLNVLRKRARPLPGVAGPNPLPDILPTLSQTDALLAVEKERKYELFAEWGHRWLDLKRTHKAESVMGALRGSNWQSTDVFYPIPKTELANNPNLVQNKGYQ